MSNVTISIDGRAYTVDADLSDPEVAPAIAELERQLSALAPVTNCPQRHAYDPLDVYKTPVLNFGPANYIGRDELPPGFDQTANDDDDFAPPTLHDVAARRSSVQPPASGGLTVNDDEPYSMPTINFKELSASN